jgi:hypothetical protein
MNHEVRIGKVVTLRMHDPLTIQNVYHGMFQAKTTRATGEDCGTTVEGTDVDWFT